MKSLFINAVYAEFKMVYSELTRRKMTLVTMAAYPYILLVFILIIGYSVGSREIFIEKLGVAPEIFFIVSGYLLMTIMGVSDDLLWRPMFDEWMGTLPYVIISPMPRLYRYLAIPLPRLIVGVITGSTSVLPLMVYYYGLQGLVEAVAVILLGMFAAILFVPFIMVIMGLVYSRGKEQWRFINVIRPLLFIVLGTYYPRFLMPTAGYLVSAIVPSSHVVEVIQRMLMNNLDVYYGFLLVAAATALFILYAPVGVYAIGVWEKSKLRQGVKIE